MNFSSDYDVLEHLLFVLQFEYLFFTQRLKAHVKKIFVGQNCYY